MGTRIYPVGKIDSVTVRAIELYDEDNYDFFRKQGTTGYAVHVDPSSFVNDPARQAAFILFAENFEAEVAKLPPNLKKAHRASTTVGKILVETRRDIVQFEIPVSDGRFKELKSFDRENFRIVEDTGLVMLNGESYRLARVRIDLSHYFKVESYRKGVNHFTTSVRFMYDTAMADANRTLEELDPDLRNFIQFCSFPNIDFDLAMSEERFGEVSRQFDPKGAFLQRKGTMTLPGDEAAYVHARLVIRVARLEAGPEKRTQLAAFAEGVTGYYDKLMTDSGRSLDELDIDMRNFYRILSAYRNFPNQGQMASLGDPASLASAVANVDETNEALRGQTVGSPATQGLRPSHQPAPTGQVATIEMPTFSGSPPAAQTSQAAVAPPPPTNS